MKVNNRYIKISGKSLVEEKELELGQEVSVSLKGSVVKVEEGDNQDGTKDLCYVIKAFEIDLGK